MNYERKYIKQFFVVFLMTFSSLLISSLLWNIKGEIDSAEEYARKEARGDYNKDLLYRRWASKHGGVYVPITNTNPPNPYLEFLPQRDIVSETGVKLTLVNPAFMTRQVHEIAQKQYGVKGHITSLNPIRPENKADEWETKALRSFENGETESSSVEKIEGEKYLRLMHSMTVEQSCMKCHEIQGYKLGEIRGGISVSVPMNEYLQTANIHIKHLILSYLITFLLVIIFGWYSYKRIIKEIVKRDLMQKKVVESKADLKKQNGEYSALNKDYIKLNNKLTYALEKTTESDRLKSAFLANVSHEIRTPLNGIMGFADILINHDLKQEEKEEFMDMINESGNRLLSTINDMLDISNLEAGEIQVSISKTNIIDLVEYICLLFKSEADSKGIQLSYNNFLPETECIIETDVEKIHIILRNLITNAIKYSNEGSIEVGSEKNDKNLKLFVKDTGIGICKEKQEIIFDRFRQANESSDRDYDGVGLGLTITKAYVELLGGRIWVESEIGKGSVFYFTLPYGTIREEKIAFGNVEVIEMAKEC
jgi:signal transduction histidine kinase